MEQVEGCLNTILNKAGVEATRPELAYLLEHLPPEVEVILGKEQVGIQLGTGMPVLAETITIKVSIGLTFTANLDGLRTLGDGPAQIALHFVKCLDHLKQNASLMQQKVNYALQKAGGER